MMKSNTLFLIGMFCLCIGIIHGSTPVKLSLHANWEFRQVGDSLWNKATVPGNIHTDLLQLGLIPHPFIGNNEDSIQWVSERDWEYRSHFELPEEVLNRRNRRIEFQGLDTYAKVILNDKIILESNNAFRSYSVDVTDLLRSSNELYILFEHPAKYEIVEKGKLSYELPEGNRIFTRKAQFQYGWDWGPKINTMGIWQSIELTAYDAQCIEDVSIKQVSLDDDLAQLSTEFSFFEPYDSNYEADIWINGIQVDSKPLEGSALRFSISNPKLWWPHNVGKPNLYRFTFVIRDGSDILDSISIKKGLRTVKLVTTPDSIGRNFYFEINGKPIYAKGANYIPQNSFQNLVSEEHYEELLSDVVDANMNMLRVWGGGIYEQNQFYELCDEKGIMVWQDFMFACAMYPGDNAFLENVEKEARQQVTRMNNHASIVLWCGNNESSEGWHRWGWRDDRSEEEKRMIWGHYRSLFNDILPKVVRNYSDNIPYWESSPSYGRGNPKYEFQGDAHDWWVWHDAYPFEHFTQHVPRFMSEFGFQSFPSFESVQYINQSDSVNIWNQSFSTHQKHRRGFELINEYMERDFPVPTNPLEYVYQSHLLQSYGMIMGIEAHRRAKPYNMGTLYWQLNDCWPVTSWSSIDFFGNKKALYHHSKRAFDNVLVSSILDSMGMNTYLVNDHFKDIQDTLYQKVIDFNGNVLYEKKQAISVKENSSSMISSIAYDEFEYIPHEQLLVNSFQGSKEYKYFTKPKKMNLPKESIIIHWEEVSDGYKLTLHADSLQKNVFLYTSISGTFDDNYIDLLPGESTQIMFRTTEKLNKENLKILTLNKVLHLNSVNR